MKKNILFSILFLLFSIGLYADDITGVVTKTSMPTCPDGAVNITVSGGFAPYTFTWTGPNNYAASTEDISGIKAGTYTVTVNDALCGEAVATFVVGSNDVNLVVSDKKNIEECSGPGNFGPGYIKLANPGAGFTFHWSGPNGFSSSSKDITNLLNPGTYKVTITNASGCTKVLSEFLCCCDVDHKDPHGNQLPDDWDCFGDAPQGNFQLSATLVSPSGPNSNDGSINFTALTGDNSTYYMWTGPNGFTAYTEDLSGIGPGQYCVTVTDGCRRANACYTLVNCAATNLNINGAVTNTCPGYNAGKITVTASGSTGPYKYKWDNGQMYYERTNLAAGTYCITVSDVYGCTKTACFVVGSNNTTRDECKILCNGTIVQETEPYYVWDNNDCRIRRWYCNDPGEDYYLGQENVGITNVGVDGINCEIKTFCGNGQVFQAFQGEHCRDCIIFIDENASPDRLVCCHVDYCFFSQLNASLVTNIQEHNSVTSIQIGDGLCNVELWDNCVDIFGGEMFWEGDFPCNQIPIKDGNCGSYFQPGQLFDGNPFGEFGLCGFGRPEEMVDKTTRNEILNKLGVKTINEGRSIHDKELKVVQELKDKQIVLSDNLSCENFSFTYKSPLTGTGVIKIKDLQGKMLFFTNVEMAEGRNNLGLNGIASRLKGAGNAVILEVVLPNSESLYRKVSINCDNSPVFRDQPVVVTGDINVYPNPTDGIVNVEINSKESRPYTFEVFNVLGAIVLTLDKEETAGKSVTKIDLSNLPAGSYMLTIKGADGTVLRKENIVKQ